MCRIFCHFLADVQKLRYFLKKNVQLYGFSIYFHIFVEQKACAQKLFVCVSFHFPSKCMGGGQNILPELVSRVAAQF